MKRARLVVRNSFIHTPVQETLVSPVTVSHESGPMSGGRLFRDVPFPECARRCELVKILGVCECESVCPRKFDSDGNPLKPSLAHQTKEIKE
jgi:hypothetical protein